MDKVYPEKVYLLGDPYADYRVPLRITWRVFAMEVFASGLGILLLLTALSASSTVQQVLCASLGLPLMLLAGYVAFIHIREITTMLVVAPGGLARIRWGRADLFYWRDVRIDAISPGIYMIYRETDGARITHVALSDNRVSSAIERKFRMQRRE